MRNVLLLSIICEISVLANAGLTITGADMTVEPGTVISVGVFSDGGFDTLMDLYILTVTGDALIDVSGAVNTINYGAVFVDPYYNPLIVFLDFSTAIPEIPGVPPGQVADDILVTVNGPLSMVLTDLSGRVVDTAEVDILPEPATLVLLGLGGVLLRRR